MTRANLIEVVANLAEAESNSRPSLTAMASSARIPMAGLERRGTRGAAWTPQEDAFLKANLGVLSLQEIGRELGRTADAVHNRWERDLHLPAPRRNPNWLTLETFARGLGTDSHSIAKLADRGLITARWLPATFGRTDGHRGIRVIDRRAALAWIADPLHWIYFKPERVGTFRKQGRRWMAKPDVIFWREARTAIDERRRTWKDAWLTPRAAGRLIGVSDDKRINRAIRLGLLPATRWGNWWILGSEALRFARERVAGNWGPRKIRRIRFAPRRVKK